VAEHQHDWHELHRIDPEESRAMLGTIVVERDGTRTFSPELDRDDNPKFGAKRYNDKVIVMYCPDCGEKEERPWTD
jgi:hypothetical protein